eukprot:7290317-Prymnesium_polylepis.1
MCTPNSTPRGCDTTWGRAAVLALAAGEGAAECGPDPLAPAALAACNASMGPAITSSPQAQRRPKGGQQAPSPVSMSQLSTPESRAREAALVLRAERAEQAAQAAA